MENENLDLGLTNADSMSVDAILAEYEAENGKSAPAPEVDALAASAQMTGEAAPKAPPIPKYAPLEDEDEDYPNRRHSLSQVINRAKRDIPDAPPPRTPGMSVDEIVFSARMEHGTDEIPPEYAPEAESAQVPTSAEYSADSASVPPTYEQEESKSKRRSPTRGFLKGIKALISPQEPAPEPEDDVSIPTFGSKPGGDIPYTPTFGTDAGASAPTSPTFDENFIDFSVSPPTLADETANISSDVPTSEKPAPEVTLQQIYTSHEEKPAEDNPFASLMTEGLPPERRAEEPVVDEPITAAPETESTEIADGNSEGYAKKDIDYNEYFEDELRAGIDERTEPKPSAREKLMSPFIAISSYNAAKREKRRAAAAEHRFAPKKDEAPELHPGKAALLYAQQSGALRLRCILATILTAVLAYISYGLPAAGLLGDSPTVKAIVCLIMMLTVMIIGLDIFTTGIVTLFSGKPGAESLICVSSFVALVDAVYIALTGSIDLGVPFCGVAALSMTFALWGSKLNCDNFAISFYTAAKTEDPSVILSEAGVDDEGCALAKSKRPVTGFVRTAETADIFENAYHLFAPVMIAACVILSLFCFVASKECTSFVHTLGASTSICASLSAFFGMAFPFSVAAKRLARSGVAIAGYSGCAELGRVRRVIITDSDLFPARTISVADISIAETLSPQKVISYTGSMIAAAGMCTAPAFLQLMRKNGCVMQTVEDFACHEGGGVIARINGEQVYVGTASFMRLMGVRLPSNTATRTCIYTAINDSLAGFFSMNYTAVASVQRALVMLLSGAGEPVFAIRDFNITPLLIKQKFRLPSGIYDFPSFADRYKMSAPETEENGQVSAVYSRGGLGAIAGLAKRGRKLYLGLKICCVLSVFGSLLGMILMLALCWSGAFASASCGNIMTYMLLWLVPSLVIAYGLRN